jgi:Protein of unknown function (DUF2917)
MQRHTESTLTKLLPGSQLSLPGGASHCIAVFAGLVWITQEGDRRDHCLATGDSLELHGEGDVVVHAVVATQLLAFQLFGLETEAAAA